ncbi:type II restriction endonuclease [Weissella cibaria]|uniref:Type-2 restriction enzyme n=1 Tax=Weissella cibaria TaxID=137591 RepID=A0A2S1KPK3_9LACO|nr:type II restriction endonuclease [Weissella cibaria]AWF94947.1 Type-2 restriction enzyme LlaDCHI [Weissella cibaria]
MDFEKYMSLPWQEKLEEFMTTRSVTNRTPAYYINWDKVRDNTTKYEVELNTLNYLVGKNNINEEATMLFTKQPNLLKAIPTLIANRDYDLDILRINDDKSMSFDHLNFTNIDETKIEDYVTFMEESGLLAFLQNDAKKSLVDYAFGVEAGLDSNGRKNRSGTQNEEILEINLSKLVEGTDWQYATQIGVAEIKRRWDIDVPTDKSSRRFDGVVYNPSTKTVTLIETNFYGGGGSKLKAVSGEFRDLNGFVTKEDVQFVWISDGMGWDTARLPMSEAFEQIPYIINLNMVNNGYLRKIVDD